MASDPRAVLEAWLAGELEAALAFVDRRLRREIPLPGVRGLLAAVLVDRARGSGLKKIAFLLDAAEGRRGEWETYARLQEVYRRARRDHPRFPALEAALREAYDRALELASGVLRGRGQTVADLLRSAYPDRAEALAALQRELDALDSLLGLVLRHPDLISFPGPLRDPWLRLMRESADFSRERLIRLVEDAYRR